MEDGWIGGFLSGGLLMPCIYTCDGAICGEEGAPPDSSPSALPLGYPVLLRIVRTVKVLTLELEPSVKGLAKVSASWR